LNTSDLGRERILSGEISSELSNFFESTISGYTDAYLQQLTQLAVRMEHVIETSVNLTQNCDRLTESVASLESQQVKLLQQTEHIAAMIGQLDAQLERKAQISRLNAVLCKIIKNKIMEIEFIPISGVITVPKRYLLSTYQNVAAEFCLILNAESTCSLVSNIETNDYLRSSIEALDVDRSWPWNITKTNSLTTPPIVKTASTINFFGVNSEVVTFKNPDIQNCDTLALSFSIFEKALNIHPAKLRPNHKFGAVVLTVNWDDVELQLIEKSPLR